MPASRLVLSLLFPLFAFLLTGCSVFSAIGDAISSGYDNTVSYFNAYYNADRLFSQAEDEILEAEKTARLRVSPQGERPASIPASARQKLTVVNEKCSNILSFHPESALVDDALLLIGKSYFYQTEYLKAERKFSELLSQFPTSSLAPEAELWLVKTMIRLGKNDEALAVAQSLAQEASGQGANDLAGETFFWIGDLQVLMGNKTKALESFQKVEDFTSDASLLSSSRLKSGTVLFSLGEYARAASAFLKAAELAEDPAMQFGPKLEALRSLRAAREYEAALQLAEEMLSDFRFSSVSKEVLFERGLTYAAQGARMEAMDDYRFVDSTSARTEIGAKAAFELAVLLENQEGDYRRARDAYSKALSYPVPSIVQQARRRQNALNRYLLLRDQMVVLDSLLAAEMTGGLQGDSLPSSPDLAKLDSLKLQNAKAAYDLGEVFYSELEKADSAVFWYREALASSLDSTRAARILFVLAELARTHPQRGYGDSRDLYQRLMEDYPNSVFTREAKIQLGMEVPRLETDAAESLYTSAEHLLETGKPDQAIVAMERLLQNFPWSPYAAKSRYAIGWIYENRLQQPDSALIHYKAVVDQYSNSTYASSARPRISSEMPADTSSQLRKPPPDNKETEIEKEPARMRGKQPTSKDLKIE